MSTPLPPAVHAGSSKARLLIAEPDVRVRRALIALLATEPQLIVVATCGSLGTARALGGQLRPEVALVDLLLPEARSGLALVAELSATGVAVVATGTRDSLSKHALKAGAAAFLPKDGAPEAVLQTLLAVAEPIVGTAD